MCINMNGNKLLLEEEINNCIYQIFQLRLEEKVRENAGLTRQLENALTIAFSGYSSFLHQ
jgi:hypothetical protein